MESEEDKIEKHESNVKLEYCELDFRPNIIIKESPSFLGARPKDPKIKIASGEEDSDPGNSQCCQANNDLENLNQQARIPITSVHTGRHVINIPHLFNDSNHCEVSEDNLLEANLPEPVDEFIEDDENCEFTFQWKVSILFLLSVWLIFVIYIIWVAKYSSN
jgi:hypothetical protein